MEQTGESRFNAAIRAHDEAIASRGIDIWIGAEPTFTNRYSESPEWLSEALGETKQSYALRIIRKLRKHHPGSIVLRSLGRQYPDEEEPRWSLGLYRLRDGVKLANRLPPDPLDELCADCDMDDLQVFWQSLADALNRNGYTAKAFQIDRGLSDQSNHRYLDFRLLFKVDDDSIGIDPATDKRCRRAPLQSQPIPPEGLDDDLAAEGVYLVSIGCIKSGPENTLQPVIEIPRFRDVGLFSHFLQLVADAAQKAGLPSLIWQGFPPPVDERIAWMTLTPDPAVLEVNEAPASSITDFLDMSRQLFNEVQACGLAPYRLNYNGAIAESGGGGQFTIGGPSAEKSPFFVSPHLLSRLIVYLNHHPSLSYWFAPIYVGSYSQSPRTDENVSESFSELHVALQLLSATESPSAELIWRSLSPFLIDTSGNAHRSEINIEKLWNPYLPARGCLGLVEFRAFRMVKDAESAAAIAALLRALIAMLAGRTAHPPLIDWGNRLHDRFSLPFYLLQDLDTVFDDLQHAGLGLGEPIIQRLCADHWRHVGHTEYSGCRLDVDLAIEFWPLLGDAAEQAGGSRLVDASTQRLQLTLKSTDGHDKHLAGWFLQAGHYRIPLKREQDESGAVFVAGLRYRAFKPWVGLHPGLDAQTPIVLYLFRDDAQTGLRCTLHDWQPDGQAYDGLPANFEEARRRIAERFVVEEINLDQLPAVVIPDSNAVSEHCLDLRRV